MFEFIKNMACFEIAVCKFARCLRKKTFQMNYGFSSFNSEIVSQANPVSQIAVTFPVVALDTPVADTIDPAPYLATPVEAKRLRSVLSVLGLRMAILLADTKVYAESATLLGE
jgi:hypothetical protein